MSVPEQLSKDVIYLGDGLYYEDPGYQIRLFAFNGLETLEEVFLEDEVLTAFIRALEKTRKVKIVITEVKEPENVE